MTKTNGLFEIGFGLSRPGHLHAKAPTLCRVGASVGFRGNPVMGYNATCGPRAERKLPVGGVNIYLERWRA